MSFSLEYFDIIEKNGDWTYCVKKQDLTRNEFVYSNEVSNIDTSAAVELLKNCPFIDKIKKNYKVLAIVIMGSRVIELDDEYSDIDLDVFVDEPYEINRHDYHNDCLFYHKTRIHWYYNDINKLVVANPTYANGIFLFELSFLAQKLIVFKTEQNFYNSLMQKKDIFKNIGLAYLLFREKANIDFAIKYLDLLKTNSKSLAILLLIYFIVTNSTINHEFLKRVKRTKPQELLESDKQLVVECLIKLRQFAIDHDFYNLDTVKQLSLDYYNN